MTTWREPPQVIRPRATSPRLIDLTGQTFGKWTVIARGATLQYRWGTSILWWCECECGTTKEVHGVNLRQGHSIRCAACAVIERKPAK